MEKEVFIKLIKEHERVIFKITTVYAHTAVAREDLYQEIVLQLWKAIGSFREDAKFSTWMYRVALNTAVTNMRKEKKRAGQVALEHHQFSYTDTKDEVLEERMQMLYQAIEKLKPIDKGIILLYLEEKSHEEIASIIGISTSNVGTRLSRIRQQMKKSMVVSQ